MWQLPSRCHDLWRRPSEFKSAIYLFRNLNIKIFGKIGILVPQLWFEVKVGFSTFRLANLVPQLLFLSQTHPCAHVALPTNESILLLAHSSHSQFPLLYCCNLPMIWHNRFANVSPRLLSLIFIKVPFHIQFNVNHIRTACTCFINFLQQCSTCKLWRGNS